MHVKELSEIWNNNNKKGLRLRPRKSVKHKPKPGFKCKNNSAGNESNSRIVSLGLTVWVCRGAAPKRTPDLIGCIHVSLCSPGDWKLSAVPRFTLSGSNCFHSEFAGHRFFFSLLLQTQTEASPTVCSVFYCTEDPFAHDLCLWSYFYITCIDLWFWSTLLLVLHSTSHGFGPILPNWCH